MFTCKKPIYNCKLEKAIVKRKHGAGWVGV
jgi:hypothetical protein